MMANSDGKRYGLLLITVDLAELDANNAPITGPMMKPIE